jgi:hypothetical protein
MLSYKEKSAFLLDDFVQRQRSLWPMADRNFTLLEKARTKELPLGDFQVRVQYNPDRIISTDARTDKASLAKRPCFLCPAHRFPEQIFLPVITREGVFYHILLNPFPIFPRHLVVALAEHEEQGVAERLEDLLFMCDFFPGYSFYYNGPVSGASAPDHHHFQAVPERLMPLENLVRNREGGYKKLAATSHAALYAHEGFYRGIYVIESSSTEQADELFHALLDKLPVEPGESEPRINVIAYYDRTEEVGRYVVIVVLRKCHRSHHYFSQGADHLMMSPGCADMAGYFVTPHGEDFEKLDAVLLAEMVDEITVSEELVQQIEQKFKQSC